MKLTNAEKHQRKIHKYLEDVYGKGYETMTPEEKETSAQRRKLQKQIAAAETDLTKWREQLAVLEK